MERAQFEAMLAGMGYELKQHPIRHWEYEVCHNGVATNMALSKAALERLSEEELRRFVIGICESPEGKMTERDTHFAGFAELLHTDLQDIMAGGYPIDVTFQKQQQLIAQRAYDLAYHILYYEGDPDPVTDWSLENILRRIPDLTEWPEERIH